MKTCCYHVRNVNGKKISGGMLHATTMKEAARRAIKLTGLTAIMQDCGPVLGPSYRFEKDGRRVFLHLSVSPENVLDASEMTERG